MTLTDKHITYENDCRQIFVGQVIRAVIYGELKYYADEDGNNINPEPYYMEVYLFEKYPDEVKALRPPLSAVIDHLDYIVKMIGVDHVGLGSDFDGVNSLPQQLDDVTTYPLITKELVKRGYSKKEIRKILGGNFLRVLEANSK